MKILSAADYEIDHPLAASTHPPVKGVPLRIALLVESTSAGVGRHVIDLAYALHELGHRVDLLYCARRIDERFSAGLAGLACKGVKICEIDIRHGLHPTDVLAMRAVRRYLRKNGPFDILHCHSTKAGFAGRIAAAGLGARTVYTPHALVTMSPFSTKVYRTLAGWLERSLALLGDAVICVSEQELEHARKLGIRPSALHTIPNGIDLADAQRYRKNRSAMRASFGLNGEEICVGFVGRMSPQKAPRMLLEAFALASQNMALPAKLVFVGSGSECPELRNRIDELGLQDHVMMVGEFNGLPAMSAFDIFALPSVYEGLPYVLLEALSMGLPVISTDVGGATALVHEGVNGFVVKKSMPGEMAIALRKLISDPELRRKMGAASSEMASQFSLAGMATRTEQVYRKLLLR
jgi:glycosyltransferase involved in cell wall biosynthesis